MKVVDTKTFQSEVLDHDGPVMVDYWATWCMPCKQLMPILEEVEKELGPKLKMVKLDIDSNPEIAAKYGIRGVPSLMIFKKGEVSATKIGSMPKSKVLEWLSTNS